MTGREILLAVAVAGFLGALFKAFWFFTGLYQTVYATHTMLLAVERQQAHMAQVSEETHALVNNAMRLTLAERVVLAHRNLALAKRVVALAGTPDDTTQVVQAEAELLSAEEVYNAHMLKQHVVDMLSAPDPAPQAP